MPKIPEQLAAKVQRRIEDTLAPLALEMRLAEWPADLQVFMWEALGHHALELARKVAA